MAERRAALGSCAAGWSVLAVSWWWAEAGTGISDLEEDVFRFVNDWPDWLEPLIWPIMQLGAIFAVPLVAGVAWFKSRRWRLGAGIAVTGFSAWALAKVVKELVQRGRPQDFLSGVNFRPEWEGLGFVSGHAAVAFAMAAVLAPHLARPGKAAAWALAGATAILRMYTAAHLPLDIVGGAGLGVGLAGLWQLSAGRRNHPSPADA